MSAFTCCANICILSYMYVHLVTENYPVSVQDILHFFVKLFTAALHLTLFQMNFVQFTGAL